MFEDDGKLMIQILWRYPPEISRKSLPFSHLHEMTVRIDILVTFDVSVGKSELKIKQDITQFRP